MTTDSAAQTPLTDLLRSVPKDHRLIIDWHDRHESHSIPIGRLCHEAADDIERLRNAVETLLLGLRKVSIRPAEESAFIAAVFLDEAKKKWGVSIT